MAREVISNALESEAAPSSEEVSELDPSLCQDEEYANINSEFCYGGGYVDEGSGLELNDRGNVEVEVGVPFRVSDFYGTELVEVTVGSVTVDYPCDGSEAVRQDPDNGHYVGVAMTVTSLPGLVGYTSPFGDDGFDMSGIAGSGFTVIGADGFTETSGVSGGYAAYTCSADNNNLLLTVVEPGQNYQGTIVLDTANTTGALVWAPTTNDTDNPGYELTF